MSRQGETKRVVYRHPLGRYEVTETTGVNIMGDTYHIREAELTPEWDERGLLNDAVMIAPPIAQSLPEEPVQKRKFQKINADEAKRIERLWRQGFSIRQIADDCSRADSSINAFLCTHGLREPGSKVIWTEEDDATAKRLWEAGWSKTRIAEYIGCKTSTVAAHLRKMGKKTG